MQGIPSGHTRKQRLVGKGHRIHSTTHQAVTPVNGSQVAKDIARPTEYTEPAHR